MDLRSTIKTGDTVIFCSNNLTGFFLRTFTSSEWNHSGIGVRFKTPPGSSNPVISLTDEGDLYIFESNRTTRFDDIYGALLSGVGFTRAEDLFKKYNKVAIRRLHDQFRTPELAQATLQFARKYWGYKYTNSNLPFIGVWLGITMSDTSNSEDGIFCSEFMAHYYAQCVGPQYQKLTGILFDGNPSTLFGSGAPTSENMFTPGHYAPDYTPNALILSPQNEIIYLDYANIFKVILPPIILMGICLWLVWLTLPGACSAHGALQPGISSSSTSTSSASSSTPSSGLWSRTNLRRGQGIVEGKIGVVQ